jgi:hypothetical protein
MNDMSNFVRVDVSVVKERYEELKHQETQRNWAHTVLKWHEEFNSMGLQPIIMHNPFGGEWVVTSDESIRNWYH